MNALMKALNNLSHPVVRDLAWVMCSPSLVSSLSRDAGQVNKFPMPDLFVNDRYCNRVYESNYPWLLELDRQPQPLLQYLSERRSTKLGHYFEDLVAWWLMQKIADGYFESHVKVTEGGRNIGEFDFLFRSGQIYEHWECAVKFYLYTRDKSGTVYWYGPNARDTLQKKLNRMLEHQVPLSGRTESKAALVNREIDSVHSEIFLKGYLFYPLGYNAYDNIEQVANCEISPLHLRGWWLSVDVLNDQQLKEVANEELRWRVLPRLDWLAPRIYPPDEQKNGLIESGQLVQALKILFSQSDESRLIAGYSVNGAGQWQEVSRGFVVGKNWPG